LNQIDKNYDLFEHYLKIGTYSKKVDENSDQKVILTQIFLSNWW